MGFRGEVLPRARGWKRLWHGPFCGLETQPVNGSCLFSNLEKDNEGGLERVSTQSGALSAEHAALGSPGLRHRSHSVHSGKLLPLLGPLQKLCINLQLWKIPLVTEKEKPPPAWFPDLA